MANKKTNNSTGSTNDGLALVIGGLFVLALVFATYSYFNRTPNIESEDIKLEENSTDKLTDASEDTSTLGDRIRELFNSDKEGELNGEGAKIAADTTKEPETVLGTSEPKVLYSKWEATDYKQGDINADSYVVQSGDTLWEIAEAKYGNGADWTKILAANANSVGYLPNGQQALIQVGQTIVLP